MGAQTSDAGADELVASIEAHLKPPRTRPRKHHQASGRAASASWVTGAPVERTGSNCEAAEADLLRLAPLWYLRGQMPSFGSPSAGTSRPTTHGASELEELARAARTPGAPAHDRDAIVTAVRGATSAGRREVTRVRSFRNVLYVAAR